MTIKTLCGAESLIPLADQPVTIVCLGDSVTGVYYHTGGQRAYPEMLEIAIAKAVPSSKVKVINAGISGHSTNEGLKRLDRDVLAHKPQLVTISFGLNDLVRVNEEQFRSNLDMLVTRCQDAGSRVVLCTPNAVITTSSRPVEKLQRYCEIIRTTGRDRKISVCDQFAAGESVRAKDAWSWRLTLSDEIHPNMDGHKAMAEVLCQTITGKMVSLADVPPPPNPLSKTEALLKEGKPVKVLAMPPYDTLVGPALKQRYPNAMIDVVAWPTTGKSLRELETAANQLVRPLKPNLVVIAVPPEATADSDEAFVKSYSWIMNWSLSFGLSEWDCLVVHPSVTEAAKVTPRDDLIRQLVKAQHLHLIDRAKEDQAQPEQVVTRWFFERLSGPSK